MKGWKPGWAKVRRPRRLRWAGRGYTTIKVNFKIPLPTPDEVMAMVRSACRV